MAGNENMTTAIKEEARRPSVPRGYREVPGIESDRLDVIEQLHANLSQLEDLHARLNFVMTELRTLLPRQ